ncbi:MAG TPA: hypothetical protein VMY35_17620 [Phycisphaerae bacterium]|nr:hypothetical protein [Phycisphaerae bacterium]
MGVTGHADSVAASPGTTKEWTRTTLATHLMPMAGGRAKDADGTASQALKDLVLQAFCDVWEWEEWQFRETQQSAEATMTLAADATSYNITDNWSDFGKLVSNRLFETSGKGDLIVHPNFRNFNQAKARWMSAGTLGSGVPEVGRIVQQTAGTDKVMLIVPKSDGAYTYLMPYLTKAPTLGLTDVPDWDDFAHKLWRQWALILVKQQMTHDDSWKDDYSAYKAMIAQAQSGPDEEQVNTTGAMFDAHGDLSVFGEGCGGNAMAILRE